MEKMEKRNDRNRYKSDEQVIDELRSFLAGKCCFHFLIILSMFHLKGPPSAYVH